MLSLVAKKIMKCDRRWKVDEDVVIANMANF